MQTSTYSNMKSDLGEWDEPRPNPLPAILEETRNFINRYIAFQKPAHAVAIALWSAHTWVIEAFDYTPYLHICSPVKRCGKSRVFDCLRLLCAKPWPIISATEAVLFRKIEKDRPTILLDEVDTIFSSKGKDDANEGLRALLNAGFERRAVVPRCVGPQFTLTEFRVFCPKALAGIGKLPDTVSDRSITIAMVRRARRQKIEKFRSRDAEPEAKKIASAFEAWSQGLSTIQSLHAARPEIPGQLGDRAADICEPLLAIADMANGPWPQLARAALIELCSEGMSEEDVKVQLLGAIRDIFGQRTEDKISTENLLHALVARDNGEPWAHFWEKDLRAGNTRGPAGRVAYYLKTFDVVPGSIREEDGSTPKGYKLESFEDAFSRYLPA